MENEIAEEIGRLVLARKEIAREINRVEQFMKNDQHTHVSGKCILKIPFYHTTEVFTMKEAEIKSFTKSRLDFLHAELKEINDLIKNI